MYVFESGPAKGPTEESRERIYGILETLLSHPDEGKWGRVLSGQEQRLAIATADSIRDTASLAEYPLMPGELSCDELDLRFLMVELCQPLEHLKGEYERVLCTRRPVPGCSPFALDHHQRGGGDGPGRVPRRPGGALSLVWLHRGIEAPRPARSCRISKLDSWRS